MTTDNLEIIDLADQFSINTLEETLPLNTLPVEEEIEEPELEETPIENIEEDEETVVRGQLKAFASELKSRNILETESEIEDEDTLFQEFEKTIDKKAIEKISAEYDLSNPQIKSVLEYVKNGGNINTYIQLQQDFSTEVDMEDEDSMTEFVNDCLKELNNIEDEEDRIDLIENLKVKGKLKEKTEYFQSFINKQKEQTEKELFQKQEEKRIQLETQRASQDKLIKDSIKSGNINGFKINASKKTDFENFLYKPVVKEVNGKKIQVTQFKERFDEYLQDPLKFTRLAYELFENFSNETIKETTEKKVQSNFITKLKEREAKQNYNTLETLI